MVYKIQFSLDDKIGLCAVRDAGESVEGCCSNGSLPAYLATKT